MSFATDQCYTTDNHHQTVAEPIHMPLFHTSHIIITAGAVVMYLAAPSASASLLQPWLVTATHPLSYWKPTLATTTMSALHLMQKCWHETTLASQPSQPHKPASHNVTHTHTHTHTQPFYGPFSATTRVSRCQS